MQKTRIVKFVSIMKYISQNHKTCVCETPDTMYSTDYKEAKGNTFPKAQSYHWEKECTQYSSNSRSNHKFWQDDSVKTLPQKLTEKPNVEKGSLLHLVAGGLAGCASTLVTCPIDVIKTRQQSSEKLGSWGPVRFANVQGSTTSHFPASVSFRTSLRAHYTSVLQPALSYPNSILHHTRYILQVEGLRSFYKGLGPSLMGVVPSRALFFFAYEAAKSSLHNDLGLDATAFQTHVMASMFGGFICTSTTCPLWVLKTKQQLHRRLNNTSLSMVECIKRVWMTEGAKGFYRGLTASYAGIVETVLYFTLYEQMKAVYIRKHCLDTSSATNLSMQTFWELPGLMIISSTAKCMATCIAYPHEVIRTRLREEPVKRNYNGFFQTFSSVAAKEGWRGFYAGLPAQLVRQVPNMAILMGVYEGVVYIARHH